MHFVAALFFVSYESVKRSLRYLLPRHQENNPLIFITAATFGEVVIQVHGVLQYLNA